MSKASNEHYSSERVEGTPDAVRDEMIAVINGAAPNSMICMICIENGEQAKVMATGRGVDGIMLYIHLLCDMGQRKAREDGNSEARLFFKELMKITEGFL